ncbi:RHS repeat-associated core domain-containing protein [Paenibacillus sp. WLX1005]|uniref:RHS repeat-associated core domain-containing protein n=1 Tax=Paenibacillus sp. WLX1005 TaxID=3243766 RepID=UPI00398412AE
MHTKTYNGQGLLTDKADAAGSKTRINYNQRGLTEQLIDRNRTTVKYTYHERGQQTSAYLKAYSSNSLMSGTLETKSIYGADGNLLTDRHELYINDAKVATQTSTIDKLDRITSLTSAATGYSARLDVGYDPLDRIANQKNTLNGTSFFTNYGYDKSRLTQVQTNDAQSRNTANTANVRYAYTPLGQVQQIIFPTLSDGSKLQESMSYDALNRLSSLTNTKGDTVLSVYSYQYDNNGNITAVTDQVQNAEAQTSTYSYDKLNRLSIAKRVDGSETQYGYDLRGNRLTQSDTRDLADETAVNYRYNLQNTLISATTDKAKTLFDYLPDGLRFKKTTGSKVMQYSYNGADQVIGDKASNGTVSNYVRGDRVLVKKDLTNQKDYYYLYNGHRDVVQMIGTDGSVVNSYQYDEWGSLTQQKETVGNEFKYAGETYDAETGLYYLKARYYDPAQGRF